MFNTHTHTHVEYMHAHTDTHTHDVHIHTADKAGGAQKKRKIEETDVSPLFMYASRDRYNTYTC